MDGAQISTDAALLTILFAKIPDPHARGSFKAAVHTGASASIANRTPLRELSDCARRAADMILLSLTKRDKDEKQSIQLLLSLR
jgi:hypothetical protein